MIKIDKTQRNYLLKNGVSEKHIHHTNGHYKTYYVTYTAQVAELLDKLKTDSLIK